MCAPAVMSFSCEIDDVFRAGWQNEPEDDPDRVSKAETGIELFDIIVELRNRGKYRGEMYA